MQMSESVDLLRALKEINKGTRRIVKLLSETLAVDAKTDSKHSKSNDANVLHISNTAKADRITLMRSTVMKRRGGSHRD